LDFVLRAKPTVGDARWQRCMVHFYRNVFMAVPNNKVREVAGMLKAIHAQEDRDAALAKATMVVERLESMKLSKAAEIVGEGVAETLSYLARTCSERFLLSSGPIAAVVR
jgi:putative transposase